MTRLLVHLPFYTLGLALWFSALAAGGIHMPVLATFAALLVASGLFAGSSGEFRAEARRRWQTGGLAAIAAALAVYCLLQALPLPLHWLEGLAPRNADIWARSLKPFALPPPEFASISLAPGRSLVEALKFSAYGLVFSVSALLSRRYGFQRIAALAFASALAVATVTVAHQLLGAERLYGQYAPLKAYSIAPLLNPNNRAGYLNLGFFCGLSLLFRGESRPYLGLVSLGLCFIAAEVLLCRSLGGSSCLALGWGIVALLALPRALRRRGHGSAPGGLAQPGVLAAIGAGAALLALVGQGSGTLGLDARSWHKLDLWHRAALLARDHFYLGVGRGAFASVFPAYQEPEKNLVFEHAENFPLQWAAEWGVPVTLVALLALGWCLAPLFRRTTLDSPTRRCALVGCCVLLLQNLADLALEVPAVMALLCCVLGALRGAARNGQLAPSPRAPMVPGPGVLLTSSGLTFLCLGLALSFSTESPTRMRSRLFAQLTAQQGAPQAAFWENLERAVQAYPAEPYFPLLGSAAALVAGRNPLPWISQALERNPASATTHLQLAQILRSRGATQQALGALRQAIEFDPESVHAVAALPSEWKLSPATFEAAAPFGRPGVPLLMMLADRTNDTALRLHLLEAALERDPDAADVHYRIAWELLHDVAQKERGTACARQREMCLIQIAQHIKRAADPGDSRQVLLESWLLTERGQPVQAEDHLAQGCRQFVGDVKCLRAWVVRALENNSAHLQEAVNTLVAAGCTDTEGCAATHLDIGNLFAGVGRWHGALTHFQHAAREASTAEAWEAVANAAERLGDETMADDARRRKALLAPGRGGPLKQPPAVPSKSLLVPASGAQQD
jgi:tetratricopeptide (TPR) repeat protein